MGDFQEDNFEQKLLSLKDTQDSIQSLSLWCLKHHQQHKKVVGCWLHVLKKVRVEQRVTLFYLANDVIQYSKRKNYPFVESWATALQKATPLVRDDKVKHKILRLLKIWDERNIYDETFLADLSGLLTAHTKKSNQLSTAELIQEFQPSLLFSKIRKCKVLEEDTDLKLKIVKECNIPVSDPDALQVVVKDRRNGDDLLQDIDDGILKLEAYTKALELEINERIEVINVLEVSEQFYETQRGEAKVVCNAYRNFGNRIKALKRKLDELLPTLPSPVPSPDINAPSPSSGSDIDIPEDNKTECYDSEKSFIGTDFVTAMNNAHEKQVQYIRNASQSYQHSEMANITYNLHGQTNYGDYLSGKDMNVAPAAGYYKNNSQIDLESPASPIERHTNTDSFSYHSEGNPIEVINSSNNDGHGVSRFLQNLMVTNTAAPVSVSLAQSKIPGLESPTDNAREVFNFIESKVKVDDSVMTWGDKPLTKYQSWPSPDLTWNSSQETPVSPPVFEQESYVHPVEYIDTNVTDNTLRYSAETLPPSFNSTTRSLDVDHRLLNANSSNDINARHGREYESVSTIPLPKHDIDDRVSLQSSIPNRNLISLTESPSSTNETWKSNDSDYRGIPMPPTPLASVNANRIGSGSINCVRNSKAPQDNIESVDMEMSDDESDSKQDERSGGTKHRKSSFKDDDSPYKKMNHQSQLLPPPNPWDMVNTSHLESLNEESAERMHKGIGARAHIVSGGNEPEFNEIMPSAFMSNHPPGTNIDPTPPHPPLPDFSCFPMPPRPSPGGMRFPPQHPLMRIPTHGEPPIFQPPDFSRLPPNRMPGGGPGPGFNRQFGFMPPRPPFTDANHPAMFSSSIVSPLTNPNQTPRKEFPGGSFVTESASVGGNSVYQSSPNTTSDDRFLSRNNFNNIEPLIKNRQFDKRLSDNGPTFETCLSEFSSSTPNKSVRSNLKEISLSAVLEKCISGNNGVGKDENIYKGDSTNKINDDTENHNNDNNNNDNNNNDNDDNDNNNNHNNNNNNNNNNDGNGDSEANLDSENCNGFIGRSLSQKNEDTCDEEKNDLTVRSVCVDNDDDFFTVDSNFDNTNGRDTGISAGADDGDDLYNNIEETTDVPDNEDNNVSNEYSEETSSFTKTLSNDFRFVQQGGFDVCESENYLQNNTSFFTEDSKTCENTKQKVKAPFQGIVPKISKPVMAPPIFVDDDERQPWPMLPVIDLSDENNSPGDYSGCETTLNEQDCSTELNQNLSFLRSNGMGSGDTRLRFNIHSGHKNDFHPRMFNSSNSERRFPSPLQPSTVRIRGDISNRARARFSSPRQDFRPRGGIGFSPNQEQIRRMPRPTFSRSPGSINNVRGNFQNSPRIFKGRPARPFRRGW
ncbi:hypothetical protein PGB90_000891 [Kerria lacca]